MYKTKGEKWKKRKVISRIGNYVYEDTEHTRNIDQLRADSRKNNEKPEMKVDS